MEINEVYASQEANLTNGSNKQTTLSDDYHESYIKHEVQLLNNNNVEKGSALRQPKQQQLEDRVLYCFVPKHVINMSEPILGQTIRLLDIKCSPETPFHGRLPSSDGCLIPSTLELFNSQASISDSFTSSLSECSPLIDESRGIALISGSTTHASSADEGGVTPELKSIVENTPAPETSQVSQSVVVAAFDLSGEENPSEVQGEVAAACERTTLSIELEERVPIVCKRITSSYELQEEVPVLCKKSTLSYEAKPEEKNQSSTPVKSALPYTGSFCEEDKEFEFLNVAPVRRSSSLKSSASSGSLLTKKKQVRFADVLGLDLESVQLISTSSEPPIVPLDALRDLKLGDKWDESRGTFKQVLQLCPCFSMPGGAPDFAKKVCDRKVLLDTLSVDDSSLTVSGSICVANVAYVKRIFVRYTTNGWLTHDDVDAAGYIGGSNGGRLDKFLFKIRLPSSFGFGNRMEFAISFESAGQVYWDNNFKANYRVECYLKQLS